MYVWTELAQERAKSAGAQVIEQRVIINDLRADKATIDHNYAKLRAVLEDTDDRLGDREKQLSIVRTWMAEWNGMQNTVTSGIGVLSKRLTWEGVEAKIGAAEPARIERVTVPGVVPRTSAEATLPERLERLEAGDLRCGESYDLISARLKVLEGRLRGLDQEAVGHDGIEALIGAFRTASDRNRKCFTDVDVKAADLAQRCAKLEQHITDAPSNPLADLDMDSIMREALTQAMVTAVANIAAEPEKK